MNKIKSILIYIYCFLSIPSGIFHEICHILFIVIFFKRINLKDSKVKITVNSNIFQFNCSISFSSKRKLINELTAIIIIIAPFFCWFIGLIFCYFLLHNYYLCLYFIVFYKYFFLSEQDFISLKLINDRINII
jgi:hypothetical protein